MHNTTDLHVALVQPDLHWLNPQANLNHFEQLFSMLADTTDLIILPEMFTSGFTAKPESLDGHQPTVEWMKRQATRLNAAVVGSIACEIDTQPTDSPSFVNRLFFVTPEGDVSTYDKRHLFQMGGEHKRYQAGSERSIVCYKGWRILLTICYDLRFPVFCRNQNDYDAMLCVANWPLPRRHAWRTLLQARAIENQSYVFGVNRVGTDGKGLEYFGDSLAVDFFGNILADGQDGKECLLTATMNKDDLLMARKSFPVLNDADTFKLL